MTSCPLAECPVTSWGGCCQISCLIPRSPSQGDALLWGKRRKAQAPDSSWMVLPVHDPRPCKPESLSPERELLVAEAPFWESLAESLSVWRRLVGEGDGGINILFCEMPFLNSGFFLPPSLHLFQSQRQQVKSREPSRSWGSLDQASRQPCPPSPLCLSDRAQPLY